MLTAFSTGACCGQKINCRSCTMFVCTRPQLTKSSTPAVVATAEKPADSVWTSLGQLFVCPWSSFPDSATPRQQQQRRMNYRTSTCLSASSVRSCVASQGRLRLRALSLSGFPDNVTWLTAHLRFSSATCVCVVWVFDCSRCFSFRSLLLLRFLVAPSGEFESSVLVCRVD